MIHIRSSLALAAAISVSGLTMAQEDIAAQVAELRKAVAEEQASLLNAQISVNGKAIDPNVLKREVIYLAGGKLVEARISDFFIEEQVEQAIANGRPKSDFQVTETEILLEQKDMIQKFAAEYPGVSFWEVVRSQYGLTKETFLHQRRQAILFDRVFFNGKPKEWPVVTREAIFANTKGEHGKMFMEQLEKVTEGVDEKGNPKKVPDFWLNMLRNFVTKQLREWSDIRWGSHGLEPDFVIKVNDRGWKTGEAFDFVKEGLFLQDMEKAIREVVIREALRQELVKSDAYLDNAVFAEKFAAYRKPFDDTPFNINLIAVRFKGYPCLEAFRARWRLVASFENMIKDEITDGNLQAHADKYAAFFADGQTSIDLIPFQARDIQSGAWVPGGMDAARKRCEAAFGRLESKGTNFEALREEVGEYFALDETRGRLGFRPLNQVRQQLRESEFTDLLEGVSTSSYLFYEAPVGKAVGPLKGSDAWYVARVNARTPARRKVNISVERDRTLVKEDYVNHRFMQWANEVMARTKIESK